MLTRFSLAFTLLLVLSSSALARSTSNASQARSYPAPPLRASSAVVMDATNGSVLFAQNAHLHRQIASTTKIMTALLALQLGDLSDKLTVPKGAFEFTSYESQATLMGLHVGQKVTLKDLLYGLMLNSGADAADTIAIHYAGSVRAFINLMNRQAAQLNMRDTHYNDTHGLTSKNNYSSAFDLATLAQYVSYLPDLMKVASTKYYKWNGATLVNLNRVLYWYPGVDGIKPGFTDNAGICQVLDARRGSRHVVVSILNTPDLVIDARNLLNFGLRDYTWIQSALTYDTPALTQKGTDASGPYTYFIGSGHYLRGKFLSGYTNSGGLTSLGFPRTEPLTEGPNRVQYFQNGALVLDGATGKVTRLPLGAGIFPPPKTTPTPTPTPTRTPVVTPVEGTVMGGRTPTPGKTPTTKPTAKPTTTPAPAIAITAKSFAGFQHGHARLLGLPTSDARTIAGYPVQIFQYGALVYDAKSHAVSLLPLGDRVLSGRHYLADHPGNVYPGGFAPSAILKAISWLPSPLSTTVRVQR